MFPQKFVLAMKTLKKWRGGGFQGEKKPAIQKTDLKYDCIIIMDLL